MKIDPGAGPSSFNAFKHHAGFISELIRESGLAQITKALKRIGHSQMDLYTGSLPPEVVVSQIIDHLAKQRRLDPSAYSQWIKQRGGFRKVTLSDTSQWILRLGTDRKNYVHIHPARYSPHTLRVTSGTLKTAIAIAAWMHHQKDDDPTLDIVNTVRQKYASLPPVKNLNSSSSLIRIIGLIRVN